MVMYLYTRITYSFMAVYDNYSQTCTGGLPPYLHKQCVGSQIFHSVDQQEGSSEKEPTVSRLYPRRLESLTINFAGYEPEISRIKVRCLTNWATEEDNEIFKIKSSKRQFEIKGDFIGMRNF